MNRRSRTCNEWPIPCTSYARNDLDRDCRAALQGREEAADQTEQRREHHTLEHDLRRDTELERQLRVTVWQVTGGGSKAPPKARSSVGRGESPRRPPRPNRQSGALRTMLRATGRWPQARDSMP